MKKKDIDARPDPYKTPSGDLIVIKDTAKNQRVYSTKELWFLLFGILYQTE